MSDTNEVLQRLFVYGTLKRGHYNHTVLGDSHYIGKDSVYGAFALHDLGSFPGVVTDTTVNREIFGEVYELTDPEIVKDVEYLEGYPTFYYRLPIVTTNGAECEMYVLYNESRIRAKSIIEDGEWK